MIDTVTGTERNLKDIRQIGTPSDEDKIYIEDAAYQRIHAEDYASKRVFVFMGHTECEEGKYTTFVEAAIPVRDIEFVQNLPKWNNRAWTYIFREIKRSYEDSIIVGWALDIKGFIPRMCVELEEIHREQFGGAHQVLFLMDSLEGEEYFYINKGNRLQKRDGFYIYYNPQGRIQQADVMVEMPETSHRRRSWEQEAMRTERRQEEAYARRQDTARMEGWQVLSEETRETGGSEELRYRDAMQQKASQSKPKASSYAMAAAIVLLVGILGVGIYQDRIHIPGIEEAISAMSGAQKKGDDAKVLVGTELTDDTNDTQKDDSEQETLNLIPVEELPAGEIRQANDANEDDTKEDDADTKPENNAEADTKSDNSGEQDEDGGKSAENDVEADSDKVADADDNENADDTMETDAETADYYIVQRGDTLTAICNRIYGSTEKMAELAEKNGIEDSDDIRVGQKLLLP